MSNEQTVDKLVDLLTKQNSFLSTEKTSDATELKKAWFQYVLSLLEQAQSSIESLQKEFNAHTQESLKEHMRLKDSFRDEVESKYNKLSLALEKHELRAERLFDELEKRIESTSLPTLTLREEFKKELEIVKRDFIKDFNEFKEKQLDPVKLSLNTVKVKMAVYGVIGGVVGTGVISIIVSIIKSASGLAP